MNNLLLTEQQLQERYDFLPEKIKDVFESEKEIEAVRQICRAHHLNNDEKVLIVEQLAGFVLLGFLSAGELSKEISENLHLNIQHSNDIASEINQKIFAPIKLDIERNYSLIAKTDLRGKEEVVSPPVFDEDEEKKESEENETKEEVDQFEVVRKEDSKAEKSAPFMMSDIISSEGKAKEEKNDEFEIIDMSEKKTENKVLFPPSDAKLIEIKKPEIFAVNKSEFEPSIKIIDEKEAVKDFQPKVESNVFMANDINNSSEQATKNLSTENNAEPVIIHKETEFKPLLGTKGSFKYLGGLFGFLRQKRGEEEPSSVRAEISFDEPIKVNVVDYEAIPEATTSSQNQKIDSSQIVAEKKLTEDNQQEIKIEDKQKIKEKNNEIEPPIKIIEN